MVKSIILSLIVFCLHVNSYSNIHFNQKQYSDSSELKRELVVKIAHSFDGIKEIPQNKGFNNKSFEKAMRNIGWKTGQAWCAWVLKLIYDLAEVKTTITGWSPSSYNRNNVVYTDGKFLKRPKKGDAVSFSYQRFRNDRTRFKAIGHAGLLLELNTDSFVSAEGNTSSSSAEVVREGDVFTSNKIRPITSNVHFTRWIGK